MSDDDDTMYDGMTKVSISDVKVGMIIMLKQRPCTAIDYHSGKHGATKAVITGCDIITDEHIEICASALTLTSFWIPNVKRITFNFIDIQDDLITLLNEESGETSSYKVNLEDDGIKYIISHKDDGDIAVTMIFVLDEYRIIDIKLNYFPFNQ